MKFEQLMLRVSSLNLNLFEDKYKKNKKKYILSKFQVAVFSFLSRLPSAQKILMSGKVFALAVKIPVSPQELSSDGLPGAGPCCFR